MAHTLRERVHLIKSGGVRLVQLWEGVATEFLRECNGGAPADIRRLARCAGLSLRGCPHCEPLLVGAAIQYDSEATDDEQRNQVATALAHWLLQRHGIDDAPEAVGGVVAALLGQPSAIDAATSP